MNHSSQTTSLKLWYRGTPEALGAFCAQLRSDGRVERVDVNYEKCVLRVITSRDYQWQELERHAQRHGLIVSENPLPGPAQQDSITVSISGMTCSSCEVLIEQKFKTIPGVLAAHVNARSGTARVTHDGRAPSLHVLEKALGDTKYHLARGGGFAQKTSRPSIARLVGVFAFALLALVLLSKLGIFKAAGPSVTAGTSLGAIFILGLVAATSSCLATVGGLLISSVAESEKRRVPTLLFILGRLVSYAAFGALIGLLGSAVSPSPAVTGFIVFLAAVYMIVMGLDMLGIVPVWLKRMLPTMPKGIASRLLSHGGNPHALTPFLAGAATFFVPCGFTQSIQLYALTTGSPVTSALVLFVFALGTSPALGALGFSLDFFSGAKRVAALQFAGALVLLMGFANIQNAATIAGHPLSFDWIGSAFSAQASQGSAAPLPPLEGNVQVIRMSTGASGYEPNRLTVRAGIPTRWIVDGTRAAGCMVAFQAPQLGIKKILEQGENVFEFTAPRPGTYAFSCSMGMYRGSITAI